MMNDLSVDELLKLAQGILVLASSIHSVEDAEGRDAVAVAMNALVDRIVPPSGEEDEITFTTEGNVVYLMRPDERDDH